MKICTTGMTFTGTSPAFFEASRIVVNAIPPPRKRKGNRETRQSGGEVNPRAGAIIESVANRPERDRRGRNALDLVRSNYSWRAIAKRFEEVYRQVLIAQGRGS